MNIIFKLYLTIIVFCCSESGIYSQVQDFDFDNWIGKTGSVKTNVNLPSTIITDLELERMNSTTEKYLFYRIALDEKDSLKKGMLRAKIFHTVEDAQKGLLGYLEITATTVYPVENREQTGDVAFGWEYNGIISMMFTRNNVMVIIKAPKETAWKIASVIDTGVKNAPVWDNEAELSFILNGNK